MLKIENLHAHYGPIEALKGISLEVGAGEGACRPTAPQGVQPC